MEAHNSYSYNKFTTSRKLTYSYIHILPQTSSSNAGPKKGYILFLHGFPSSSYDWHHQIAHFSANGYGLIVPDLLGYGESDKPREGSFYTGKGMASDIAEILEHESIREVVGVGHDW
jgi:soluble epoxide hydrolase/lipid-phosphate phosphatase